MPGLGLGGRGNSAGARLSLHPSDVEPGTTGAVSQLRTGLKGVLTWTKLSGASSVAIAAATGVVSLSEGLDDGEARAFGVRVQNTVGDAIERTLTLTGKAASPGATLGLVLIGQSNAERMFTYARDAFEAALTAEMSGTEWQLVDAASDGSALLEASGNENRWLNANGTHGPALVDALAAIAAAIAGGLTIAGLYFNQGEGDAYYVGLGQANIDAWADGWLYVVGVLRAAIGTDVPVYWTPMNRRGDLNNPNQAGYQALRRKGVALAAANPASIVLMPEMFDGPDDGGPHRTPEGYQALPPRMARKVADHRGAAIAGGVDGPRITAAARDGVTIIATIAHDGGTDITPAAAIQGATYFIDGVKQAIGAGARLDATHVAWTLPENVPQGTNEVLVFGYGTLPDVTDYTKMLRDNQAVPLPCRFGEVAATVTNAAAPPSGPAPSQWVADPTADNAANFGLPYANVAVADGRIKVRQPSLAIWTARVKGQAEVASGTPTKQFLAGRTYRVTVDVLAPGDVAYTGGVSFCTSENVNLAQSPLQASAFASAPGALVATITPTVDSYGGFNRRNSGALGNLDLDNILIEDIT